MASERTQQLLEQAIRIARDSFLAASASGRGTETLSPAEIAAAEQEIRDAALRFQAQVSAAIAPPDASPANSAEVVQHGSPLPALGAEAATPTPSNLATTAGTPSLPSQPAPVPAGQDVLPWGPRHLVPPGHRGRGLCPPIQQRGYATTRAVSEPAVDRLSRAEAPAAAGPLPGAGESPAPASPAVSGGRTWTQEGGSGRRWTPQPAPSTGEPFGPVVTAAAVPAATAGDSPSATPLLPEPSGRGIPVSASAMVRQHRVRQLFTRPADEILADRAEGRYARLERRRVPRGPGGRERAAQDRVASGF